MNQCFGGDVAPGLDDVALVVHLVIDYGLSVVGPPAWGLHRIEMLDAHMVNPRLAMVVHQSGVALMDRLGVALGVAFFDDLEEAVPARHRLHVEHEVVLVSQRPPDVAVGRDAGDEIVEVPEVLLFRPHAVVPPVIGVEDDDVRLDPHVSQTRDLSLEVPEGFKVRPVGIVFAVRVQLIHIVQGLVLVVRVVLGKHAHAELVERPGLGERPERLLLQIDRLMGPSVAGRRERKERRAVCIGEVELVADTDRPVHALARLDRGETGRLAIEGRRLGLSGHRPVAWLVRAEPHLEDAVPVIEAGYPDLAVVVREHPPQLGVGIRVAGHIGFERVLEDVPFGDGRLRCH